FEKGRNFKRGNGSGKKCWECGKEGHFRSECPGIESIELSDTNYEIAWNALRERYNNHKQLIHNHVKALYNIQPIAKESSAKLLSIVDEVTKHLFALKILNEHTEHWDFLVIYHIHTKLDRNTSIEWESIN
ncbi:hypothetical protein ALC57_11793, partial [Trachymyrmex cornetzi]